MSESAVGVSAWGPGWSLVASPDTRLLLARPVSAVSEDLRTGVASGDAGAVLAALATDGVAQLPDFALVAGPRVVVRGRAWVRGSHDGRAVEVRAEGREPWRDLDLDAEDLVPCSEEPPALDLTLPPPGSDTRSWPPEPAAAPSLGGVPGAGAAGAPTPVAHERPVLIESVPWRTAAGEHPEPTVSVPPAAPAPLVQPIPSRPEPTFEPTPEPVTADLTVSRTTLPTDEAPRVLAVRCPAQHPNPPHAARCRVCAEPIPPQTAFGTVRPSLGTLTLPSGEVVHLDRGVVLGRAPSAAGHEGPTPPRLVTLDSPEHNISRTHAEVVLEDWLVLVRDRGSVNGTTVTLPGHEAVRLRPGEAHLLEPGTVLTLADQVHVRYEATP